MHIFDIVEIVFVSRCSTDCLVPFFDLGQNKTLHACVSHGRSFWEPFYEFIEEFFTRYLELEWVATVLDQVIEKRNCELGCLGVSLRDEMGDGYSSITWSGALFGVDVVAYFEVDGEVGFVEGGATCAVWWLVSK